MAFTRTTPTRFPVALLNLTPESPHCPVDWRWQRAAWRVNTKSRQCERYDDRWTRRASRHLRKLGRSLTNITHRQKLDTDIVGAWELSLRNDWLRAEIDARILGDQPIPEISRATGVAEGIIVAFEMLFFDVRRRLGARSWVVHKVLGPKCWQPLQPGDVFFTWRNLGFFYGPLTVDLLVHGADREELATRGLPAYWSPSSKVPKQLQFLLITRSLPESDPETLRLLNLFIELGLCEMAPHFAPPPKDLSLDLGVASICDEILAEQMPKSLKSTLGSLLVPSRRSAVSEQVVGQCVPVGHLPA